MYVAIPRCSRNSALSMARFAAELFTWIYDNNLPLCIQVFKSSHLPQCKSGVLPTDQMPSCWCKSRSSERRINPPVNNSFGEELQDLLQLHVVFCYLQVIEHNSEERKKQDAGMAITCTAETHWMAVSCHRACGQELGSALYRCSGFLLAGIKIEQKYCPT